MSGSIGAMGTGVAAQAVAPAPATSNQFTPPSGSQQVHGLHHARSHTLLEMELELMILLKILSHLLGNSTSFSHAASQYNQAGALAVSQASPTTNIQV